MVQQNSAGLRVILYSNRQAPRGRDTDRPWPFEFGIGGIDPFQLAFQAQLKDGHTYEYWYFCGTSPVPQWFIDWNAALDWYFVPATPVGGLLGGELFNASVRPQLCNKIFIS